MRYAHVSDRRGSTFPFTAHIKKKGFNCEQSNNSFMQASNLDRCENIAFNSFS